MQRERIPGAQIAHETANKFTSITQESVGSHLVEFSNEVRDRKERGVPTQIVVVVTGNPSAGKDYFTDYVVLPYLQYDLQTHPLLVNWEDEEIELRKWGRITTPNDQPFNHQELVATYRSVKHKLVSGLLSGEESIACNFPGGTALNYGVANMNKPLWWVTRDYGDKNAYDSFRLLDRLDPDLLNNVMYLEIDMIRGPWMDVLQWYRQFMLNSSTVDEANFYNYLFGFSPFDTEEEWHGKKNGGSVLMVEEAQRAMHALVSYASNSLNNVPDNIVDPYAEDIRYISQLLEIPIRAYLTRVKYNLAAAKIYDKNEEALHTHSSGNMPNYYRRISAVNNPRLHLPEYETLQALIRLEKFNFGILKTLSEEQRTKDIKIVSQSYQRFIKAS